MRNVKRLLAAIAAATCLFVMSPLLTSQRLAASSTLEANRQIAEIYQLQAAYHAAVSGAGVDSDAKMQHLNDVLALWADDGVLAVGGTVYSQKGVPGTPSCEPGALTLCDFYANAAPPFVLGRDWLSLSPSFKTTIDVQGNSADLYFECHFVDVATRTYIGAATFGEPGNPSSGQARKVHGVWLLSYGVVVPPPLTSS